MRTNVNIASPAASSTTQSLVTERVSAPVAVRRTALYLVGEQDRSAAGPAAIAERTTICINGQWHRMRSGVMTYEQIVGLSVTVNPGQTLAGVSITYRRGTPTRPSGSLNPGDVVPIADGMLFNANATVLS